MIFSPVFYKKNFEDLLLQKSLSKILEKKRGFTFRMPEKNSPVIVIVSGGLDSIMLWFTLVNKYHLNVYPVHFTGGDAVPGEKNTVKYFYNYFKNRYPYLVHPVKFMPVNFNFSFHNKKNRKIFNNNTGLLIENLFFNKKSNKEKLFLINNPIRMASFILSAYEYGMILQANNIQAYSIFTGIVPDDGFTTRESTLTVLRSLNVYLCALLGDWRWQIGAPVEKRLFFYPKDRLIREALRCHVPVEKTWSCGNHYFFQCGLCNPCQRRQLAFAEAGIKDKTFYLISPGRKRFIKKIFNIFVKKENHSPISATNNNSAVSFQLKSRIGLFGDIRSYLKKNSDFLFNEKTGEIIEINSIGKVIYEKIKNNNSTRISTLYSLIYNRYPGIKPDLIKKDLYLFLEKLLKKKFIFIKNG